MPWDPRQYLNFADHRLRPALDLIGRINMGQPDRIIDLGCGPGNVTEILAGRWPSAQVTGIDSSPEMLGRARTATPTIRWQQADIASWHADDPADLIFSNAALHWLPDHETVFPTLINQLRPGGVLAVQMPRNFGRPTHTCVVEAAKQADVYDRLAHLFNAPPTHEPGFYYDLLSPECETLEIWETDYLQPLTGENPIVEWTKGSWLRQFLEALADDPTAQARFLESYRALTARAYPKQSDGKTLLPFLRLFILATRR